jgi:DNA-binding PadR family transcriptional regulator
MIRKDTHFDIIDLHILHHASEEPLYGLWMIEELASHGYRLSASMLYPRFHRLERDGRLRRQDKVVEGKLRKYYRTTPEGRRYFKQQKRRLMELAGEALSVPELQQLITKRAARDRRRRKQKECS